MLLQPLSSFHGPEIAQLQNGAPAHFLTLSHWIEAKKFDLGLHAELVQELLMMPGEHEARKFSRRHTHCWRSDWQLIRPRTIALGVAYYCIEHGENDFFLDSIIKEVMRSGASEPMAATWVKQGVWMARMPTVCILAELAVPIMNLNRRLRLISKRFEGGWSLVHWRGRHGNQFIHDYALNEGIPIRYVGKKDQRLVGNEVKLLHTSPDYFFVFDRKGQKRGERAVSEIRAAGKSVEVILWQAEQTNDLFI
ncbi:hypothetical protein V8Z74_14870 [Comamonas sp. w2-DMI]|uniref:hypothetical protein n=1 Tax=Comamonas sp. w2-DMI TaxID=3126391 RepID=UPI0032E480FB